MNAKESVLIVDDDETLLPMLKEGFELQGYRCEAAKSGEAALKLLNDAFFDVLVADIVLPGLKGFELIEKAKQLRPDMVAIIMTGFINKYTYDTAIEAGASDLIKKPFTLKELIIRIEHAKVLKRLRDTSVIDELTGLYNRRGFFIVAEQQVALAKREKRAMVMLYASLDALDMIHEKWGHQEGNRVLIDSAMILKGTFRKSDIIARLGQEAFVILTIGVAGDDIDRITARLQKNIEAHNEMNVREYTLSMSLCKLHYDPQTSRPIDELLVHGENMMRKKKDLD
ncbi:MAG TPA: diguanylate cyclase [Thermodesulfovibrionales bacterium]|nr:diguanylate cyclase [Thermodesulfovibrionales bacterium]